MIYHPPAAVATNHNKLQAVAAGSSRSVGGESVPESEGKPEPEPQKTSVADKLCLVMLTFYWSFCLLPVLYKRCKMI